MTILFFVGGNWYPAIIGSKAVLLMVYPSVVYASSDTGLVYPTIVFARSISLLVYPTAVYLYTLLARVGVKYIEMYLSTSTLLIFKYKYKSLFHQST